MKLDVTSVLVLAGAYLLGSCPFSYWIVRWTRGIDVRSVGSGNPGATNVLRAAGKGTAVGVLLLDVLKGALPVAAATALSPATSLAAWTALAAVCGHVFSIFLRFRGGKGVATAAGALGALLPGSAAIAAAVFLVVVIATRYVSLGSILAALSFPVSEVWRSGSADLGSLAPVVLVSALIVVRHRENIRRLLSGQESRLGQRSSS
jgi:glycerol-3-phosphate acyltransferase PlsY